MDTDDDFTRTEGNCLVPLNHFQFTTEAGNLSRVIRFQGTDEITSARGEFGLVIPMAQPMRPSPNGGDADAGRSKRGSSPMAHHEVHRPVNEPGADYSRHVSMAR
jgi:hypothetical protein